MHVEFKIIVMQIKQFFMFELGLLKIRFVTEKKTI
jgi:hypothetical protein